MTDSPVYPPRVDSEARHDADECRRLRRDAETDSEAFWRERGRRLDWMRPYETVRDVRFAADDVFDSLVCRRRSERLRQLR